MVRPTLPDDQRRQPFAVRLTAAERVTIEARAAQAGLPLAEFARQALLTGRVLPPPGQVDAAAVVALNRVGILLNQLAAVANRTGDTRSLGELIGVLEAVDQAVDRIGNSGAGDGP
jgi:hypothetical protein